MGRRCPEDFRDAGLCGHLCPAGVGLLFAAHARPTTVTHCPRAGDERAVGNGNQRVLICRMIADRANRRNPVLLR